MKILRSLSIRKKILLIPLVGSLGFCSFFIFSYALSINTLKLLDHAQKTEYPILKICQENQQNLNKIIELLTYASGAGDIDTLKKTDAIYQSYLENLKASRELSPDLRSDLDEISVLLKQYYELARKLSEGMVTGNIDFSRVGDMSKAMRSSLELLQTKHAEFYRNRENTFNAAFEIARVNSEKQTNLGLLLGGVTIALLLAFAIPISGLIKANVSGLVNTLKSIAEDNGDLTSRLKSDSKDEIGELVTWFNTFMDKLQSTIQQVVHTAPPLANLSNDIRRLSNDIAGNLDEQKNSFEKSKSSISYLNDCTDTVTQNATSAADQAQSAGNDANTSFDIINLTATNITQLSEHINEAVDIISQLKEDTTNVNTVLEVITSIAEQTNLLALNAAIEAARAGEQGRGFAVVADEVRSLANRTQESTNEITKILNKLTQASDLAVNAMAENSTLVQQTVQEAERAGDAVQGICDSVETINQKTGEIVSVTLEQKSCSDEMVSESDRLTEQSAQTAVHADSLIQVSQQLASMAEDLETITRKFRV